MDKNILLTIVLLSVGHLFAQVDINRNSLSLKDAIEIGLNKNQALKKSEYKIETSKGRYWSGISLPQPEVSINYEYVPSGLSLNNFGEKTLEIRQSFDFPSNYFLRSSKFSKEIEIAENELYLVQIDLISQIKSAYFNCLAKEKQLKIAIENQIIAEDFYKKAEIRYNVGEGTNLERLTAKVQFTEAKNNADGQKNTLNIAHSELNHVLGYGQENNTWLNLTDSLTYIKKEYTFDELLKFSETANTELKIAELNKNTASINQALSWSSLLPGFNISYSKQTLDGNSSFYGASFGISLPVWFLFDQRGQIEEASANRKIAESEQNLLKKTVYLKIKNAFFEYQNEERQVLLYLKDILPVSEEIYRAASKSFDAGEINYIEYLQAKQTLINAKSNYINSLLAYNNSLIKLEHATGINLQNLKSGDQ